jgi:hypothetical protein
MRRMFNAEEILHSSWDGTYLVDLKNDRREGKTIGSIVQNKKEGRKTQK